MFDLQGFNLIFIRIFKFFITGTQGVSYTTGVPAMIGAMMFLKGLWKKPGVYNVEEFNPDPFMEQLNIQGLPWVELHNVDLEL